RSQLGSERHRGRGGAGGNHRLFKKLAAGQMAHDRVLLGWRYGYWASMAATLAAASRRAFSSTSAIATGLPPWRLLSSAASIKAKISIVVSGSTGGLPVRKKRPIW